MERNKKMNWMVDPDNNSTYESRVICIALCYRFNCSGRAWCTLHGCSRYNGNCIVHTS